MHTWYYTIGKKQPQEEINFFTEALMSRPSSAIHKSSTSHNGNSNKYRLWLNILHLWQYIWKTRMVWPTSVSTLVSYPV